MAKTALISHLRYLREDASAELVASITGRVCAWGNEGLLPSVFEDERAQGVGCQVFRCLELGIASGPTKDGDS